jgi:hypothetical protein
MIDESDLVPLVADHADLAQLCSALEACADALPKKAGASEMLRLCDALEQQVSRREARERLLLETVFTATKSDPSQAAALAHIRDRCVAQVAQAQDLAAALCPDGLPPGADTLGYMLRCLFEACRADMVFEQLVILHFAGERLTANARALLQLSFEARCSN